MRRIKILLVALLSCASFAGLAQKGTAFVGIDGGISLPMGNWSKSNYIVNTQGYSNDPSGFANKAGIGSLDGAYFFSRYIGVGALVSYATYNIKDLDVLSGGYRESFDVDRVTTTASSYKMLNVLAGLYFNFPVISKWSVTARALAGITDASTPEITVDVEDGGVDDGTFEQKQSNKTAFALNGGIGIRYKILKCFAINLRGDYFYSKPDFKIENTERHNSAGRLVNEYSQPLSGINVSLGVAYSFGWK
jgi:hypothetical protein